MSRCSISCPLPQKQSGVALLAFALVLIVGTSYLLIKGFNANLIQVKRQHETRLALHEAKQALIGYATTYPDHHPGEAPGYLVCPDRDNDGDTDAGACSLSGGTSIGRFPYKTLETSEFRDGSGERLWYVVSDIFRNNPKKIPLNSETAGDDAEDMTVNSIEDVAAVIFAPGVPQTGQERQNDENNMDNYLEAMFTNSNKNIITADTDDFIVLTKGELMRFVEKRVLGELYQVLTSYQNTYTAYPWLSPFTNPDSSAFHAELDVSVSPKDGWQGHIPFHWSGDPSVVAGVNPFSTSISARWNNITNANTSVNNPYSGLLGFNTLMEDCLNNIDCSDPRFPVITELDSPGSLNCTWTDKDTSDCDSFTTTRTTTYQNGVCAPGTLSRTYTVSFPSFTGTSNINNPAPDTFRTRDVTLDTTGDPSQFLPVQSSAIQIADVFSGPVDLTIFGFGCLPISNLVVASGESSFDSDTDGIIATASIHYDFDVDDDELPLWFVENEWHKLSYIAYPEAENLPGSTSCTPGADCLVLTGYSPNVDTRGLILVAGEEIFISGVLEQDRSASPLIDDYFELTNNTNNDGTFIRASDYNAISSMGSANPINDQVKILDTP